ncbi:hypothetical protein LINPERPRIM_LOCUS5282 [Linum perenne]
MGRQISLNLPIIFFIIALLLIGSSCGMDEDVVKNHVIPNDEQVYCERVVCKGLNCASVYIDKGMCWCVLKGPQVTFPCVNN